MGIKKIFFFILLIALLIRLPAINNALYTDESHYANIKAYFSSEYYAENGLQPMEKEKAANYFSENFNTIDSIAHHPPLAMALFAASTFVFGETSYALRIVPLIFGLISILLIYLTAKTVYNEKAALFASLISAISFYAILSSLQIDVHGSIQTTFFLLAAYLFFKYEKTESRKWFYLSAVAAGVALLNVITGLFIFAILGLYMLIQSRNIIKTATEMIKYFFVSALTFSIFPILSFVFNKDIFLRTLLGFSMLSQNINLRFIIFLLIWVGPLLLGLSVLGLRKLRKQDSYFIIWTLLVMVASIFTYANASLDRYLMLAIAPLCLLSGKALSSLRFNKKQIISGVAVFVIFLAILECLNFFKTQYIEHSLAKYMQLAAHLDWSFYFPITGPTGPTFGLVFSSIALSLIISGIVFVIAMIFLLKKKTNLFRYALITFIATSFAFNTLLLQEYLIPSAHPDISKANYELIDYYKANKNTLPEKVYTNNRALYWYLGKNGKTLLSHTEETKQSTKELINEGNITVMLIEYPKIARTNYVWDYLQEYNCELQKTSYSKNKETGYIYTCIC